VNIFPISTQPKLLHRGEPARNAKKKREHPAALTRISLILRPPWRLCGSDGKEIIERGKEKGRGDWTIFTVSTPQTSAESAGERRGGGKGRGGDNGSGHAYYSPLDWGSKQSTVRKRLENRKEGA